MAEDGRGAALAAAFAMVLAGAASGQTITAARYADPTTRYDHGVLGDAIEHGSLRLTLSNSEMRRLHLPETSVFEDTAPRLADLDGDGRPEVITVESSLTKGARLAIFSEAGLVAATPYIGRRHRWLAPVGVSDLDGDGKMEIAYVDRPHLLKTLRVWRFEYGALTHLADLSGVTNHRIGEQTISGGMRDCGDGPEMILANSDWTALLAIRFDGARFSSRTLSPNTRPAAFASALACGS